ncbi:MAG: ATP-binding cassette domain-containing protein [Acidobacteriota bacterium]
MSGAPVVEARGISKSFAIPAVRRDTLREHALALFRRRQFRTLRVLDGVSFALGRGETLGIMGRNGSGKSTLLKIVTGIYRADAGSITLAAPVTPVLELGVGFNHELNAIDNILLIGTVMGFMLKEMRGAAREILESAGLAPFAGLELKHFSSGMSARLAWAIAFRTVKEVLILDEVVAVGDAEFRARCRRDLEELHEAGHSLLLVSHNPDDIARFCRRALLLEAGRVVLEGSGSEVASAYLELLQRPSPPASPS